MSAPPTVSRRVVKLPCRQKVSSGHEWGHHLLGGGQISCAFCAFTGSPANADDDRKAPKPPENRLISGDEMEATHSRGDCGGHVSVGSTCKRSIRVAICSDGCARANHQPRRAGRNSLRGCPGRWVREWAVCPSRKSG
ncbi:UNVERIFIED_CONTAM: hypothetical protein Slati_2514200 [Sesamum latifolium]|uniref:Uncharacterized protein n=1 Tax=Sesamum latifolium TaxID=2727402 RepID=A0AAW2WIN9_9LAMI